MRTRGAALVLVTALAASCTRAPVATQHPRPHHDFSVRPVSTGASPSPMVQVEVGGVHAVFPSSWHAEPLPGRDLREGFVASPRIDAWQGRLGAVQGIEVFWVDLDRIESPTAYYYLAARNARLRPAGSSCSLVRHQVLIDHPPDFTGGGFSQSDFVATAEGRCGRHSRQTRWVYVVAAPGFGPARQVGIPTSGLYVVMAEVSGAHAAQLLKEMLAGTSFGGTPISQIAGAAGHPLGI